MGLDIRPIGPHELEAHMRVVETAFGAHLEPGLVEFHRPFVELDRTLAAFEDGAIVGGAGAISFVMTVPGGEVPAAGITSVGVLPTHRRRGVNTELMRAQLDAARQRGEPIAALYASEGGIYGRFGFGLASLAAGIDVETERSRFVAGYRPSGSVRLFERGEALRAFLPLYEEVRRSRPGMMRLDERFFAYRFDDAHQHGERLPTFFAGHHIRGRLDGYVVYRIRQDWRDAVPRDELQVEELVATTAGAYAELWRYVLDVDLIHRVTASLRPSDEPLLHLMLEPRRLRLMLRDGLWVRLVDVPQALEARTYAVDGAIALEIADAFCAWNEGRYELRVSEGRASCARSDRDPDLVLGAAELGAVVLGGTSFSQLRRAGRVDDRSPGAVALGDAMFGWDPAPWCTFTF